MIVSLIAAYSAENRAIGYQGDLPWHLPIDLARFKNLTMGHSLIMGRRTFESLSGRTLPGRRIIVLSKNLKVSPEGADGLASGLLGALRQAQFQFEEEEAFIAGGEQVYSQALAQELVDRMYLTLVQASLPADVFFPKYNPEDWELIATEYHPADERNPYNHTFQILERVSLKPAA